jgi:hypothetical protein
MTFFGVGDQDWVELDLDLVENSEIEGLMAYLADHRARIEEEIGPFEVEIDTGGAVRILGRRCFRAQLDRSGRVMFTGLLDPEGPL